MKFLKGFKIKKWMVVTAIVVLAVIIGVFAIGGNVSRNNGAGEAKAEPFMVMRRDIVSTITGTATIKPKDQYSISSLANGTVLRADFKEGDMVRKGDVLYEIDAASVSKNVESANISLTRAEIAYNDALKTRGDLNVTSDVSGVISKLYVKLGDMVQANGKVADIYDSSYMELELPFNSSDIPYIYVGDNATVRVANTSDTLWGTVTAVNNAPYAKAGNMLVQNVTIEVANPGVLTPSDTGTAVIGGISCNDSGSFRYITEKSIYAKTSGEVAAINTREGNRVMSGGVVVTLNDDAVNKTISDRQLSLEDARVNRSKILSQLDDYTITAPISGKVVTKNIKAGDKIDNNNRTSVMAMIYDMSSLMFDMNIDELDINKIEVGQEVTITVDALNKRQYTGYIDKVSIDATTSNGVTTYPISVTIDDFDQDLIPGMNIDATIIYSGARNALAIPKRALSRGNLVEVKGEKESETDEAHEGYKTVTVETGVSDDTYIEIKSGLKEGDIVRVEVVQRQQNNMMMMPGGPVRMGPGGGGGPGGGTVVYQQRSDGAVKGGGG